MRNMYKYHSRKQRVKIKIIFNTEVVINIMLTAQIF